MTFETVLQVAALGIAALSLTIFALSMVIALWWMRELKRIDELERCGRQHDE